MLLLVWSPVLTCTVEVSRDSYTQSSICSMCRKEFSTNLASQCTVVCTANHRAVTLRSLCTSVRRLSAAASSVRYTRRLLVVPRCRLSTLGLRTFSVDGPSLWSSLPDSLRDPHLDRDGFRRLLKTHLLHCTKVFSILLSGSVIKDPPPPINPSGSPVERVTTFKLLRLHVASDLK